MAFVQGLLSGVTARGEPVDDYLADAGIPSELLAEPGARVTAEQYVALFRSLNERRGDAMLGFLSRPLRRGSFAMIVRAGVSAPSLDIALSRAANAFNVLQDDLEVVPVREGALTGGSLRFNDPSRPWPHFLHELMLRVFWRLLAWLAGGRLPAARFDFAFPAPSHASAYGVVFPASLTFDCRHSAFWFDARRLQAPVRRDEAAVSRFLAHSQANVILPRPDGEAAVAARLRAMLQAAQPQWPALTECARALHLSSATLQRHLAREGLSFQSLKDELRRDLAIQRLNTSRVPLTELASELGFADSASFQRAFKKWTGGAPGMYRRPK
ncbi:MAG: AraC family transcriptional regulator [Panacagrimonas sp.]|jgi:AraC-like DNA-binding protein|nr:AraC family transcriptional regulator [Panacagrimonas sp.]